jgi:Flp pilus assembly protein TadG
MRRSRSGQALVEWAAVAFVLLLFGLGLIAIGQIVGEYMAVRSAASQAAFAAARAPSPSDAVHAGQDAAREAIRDSQVQSFSVVVDVGTFDRGGTVTATAAGDVNLAGFPLVRQLLGSRFHLRWVASALIEPYRSRTP